MSTYRLTDDDREALIDRLHLALDDDPALALFAAVEAIIAPIRARAEEAEAGREAAERDAERLIAKVESAEERADDLANAIRSALAAWDSPGLTYGTTAKAFDDLRATLLPDDTKEADRG